ncbi:MAG TPA: MATE family efflux transporter, partial [Chitinophagaceae bacterium]|nr:MATE family efflux transporter [Chitinophagaceae bacterium]
MSQVNTASYKISTAWSLIKRSLRGEDYDYTQGNTKQAIVLLAIPMILELSLESVFAVVDMFFVGKLGKEAVQTVGLTESVITLVYTIAIGLSTAATAVVARRTGEKDEEGAAHAGVQAIIIALALTVVITIAGIVFAADILRIMGASPEVVEKGTPFTRVMFGGSLVIIMLFLINGIFRGAGNAAIAMRSLWLASIINIILCPIFINFWGLTGAAIATTTGRAVGVIYQCYYLVNGRGSVHLKKKHFRVDFGIIRNMINIA